MTMRAVAEEILAEPAATASPGEGGDAASPGMS
jgi:hypothetical protein